VCTVNIHCIWSTMKWLHCACAYISNLVLTRRVWNYFHQLGTKRTIFKKFCEQQSAYTGYNVQITTDMHILFVGFMAITLGFQVFRKSEEYCPHEQRMYVNVSSPSHLWWYNALITQVVVKPTTIRPRPWQPFYC
jgi:hypothetical protein